MPIYRHIVVIISALVFCQSAVAALIGEGPALGPFEQRITQPDVASGQLSLLELRRAGLRMFATQFNQYDGFGDGPMNPADTLSPGGRPTLAGNGTYLRVNGLDAQSCNDCHGFVSAATMPVTLGVGGSGGLNNVAMFMPRHLDVDDSEFNGHATFDGRLIVPPSLFGVGGLQLLGNEITERLQKLKAKALATPGVEFRLVAKGIDYGVIVADHNGNLDVSQVQGIDDDLVVRPFGRKGEFATVRGFGQGAMMFHFGMQPVETVGAGIDDDGDEVTDEVLPGELSALEIFLTTQEIPRIEPAGKEAENGFDRFMQIGCGDCHRPLLHTRSRILSYSFPQVDEDPDANSFYQVDLSAKPARFEKGRRGLIVRLFGDLKRHDMGEQLSEEFQGTGSQRNREFMTAELWGVADSAPYLHDGRALTLNAAILAHGGEAQAIRDAYNALADDDKSEILAFLKTLRSPSAPNSDVLDAKAKR